MDLVEKAMAPHSSTLAWKIPWTEEPGRLQSMGLHRVGHDWATSLSLSCIGEGNGNPLQCSCLENPRDGEAWWAAVYGVVQSQTWLKQLSSSSSMLSRFSRVDPMDCTPPGSSVLPIGKDTGMGCHAFLQGFFPTQGSNWSLLGQLHWQAGFFTKGSTYL